MAETFNDFFTALLFGNGAWLGLLLIVTIIVLLTLKWKFATVVMLPLSIFLAIKYLEQNLPWQAITIFITVGFMLFQLGSEVSKKH